MCRHRPTEVVTWKVVFPRGREVKGTGVGETRPMVYQYRLVIAAPLHSLEVLALNGAKILEVGRLVCVLSLEIFRRFATGLS